LYYNLTEVYSYTQIKFDHTKALEHLGKESTNCNVPPAERKMLYDAFVKIDESAFQRLRLVLGAPKWNIGFKPARPVPQVPRARANATTASAQGSSTITVARRPSLGAQQQPKPKAVQPIAAKVAVTEGGALRISPTRLRTPKGQSDASGHEEGAHNRPSLFSGSASLRKADQTTSAADQSMDSIHEDEEAMHDQRHEAVSETWGVAGGAGNDSGREAMSDGEEDELAEDDAFIYEPLPPQEPGTPSLQPKDFERMQPFAKVVNKPAVAEQQAQTKAILHGQTVSVAGTLRPIRPYKATLELIRQDNAMSPFEVREATEYTKPSLILRKKDQRTYLEVYFPWRSAVAHDHDPSLCGNVCSGHAHFYDGPICRFCKKGIRREREAKVSYSLLCLIVRELIRTSQQSQLDLLVALNHLKLRGKCSLPDDEKELLVQAIEKWDAEVLNVKKEQQQRARDKAVQQAKLRETSAQEASLADLQCSIATQTEREAGKSKPNRTEEEEDLAQHARASRPSILPTPEPSDSSPHSPRLINGQQDAQLAKPFQPLAVPSLDAPRERKSSGWNLDAQGLLNSIRNASMPARTVSPIAPEPAKQQAPTELSMEEVTLQAVARVMKLAEAAKQAAAAQASSSAQDVVEETDDEQQPEVREWPTFTEDAIVSRPPDGGRGLGQKSAARSTESLLHAADDVVPQSKLFKSSSPPEPEVTVKVEEHTETPEKALLQATRLPSRPGTAGRSSPTKLPQMASSHALAPEARSAMQFDDFESGMGGPAEDGEISSDSEGTDAHVEKELFGTSPAGEHSKGNTVFKRDAKTGRFGAHKEAAREGPKSAKKSKVGREIELSAALFPEDSTKKPKSKGTKDGKSKKTKKDKKEMEAKPAVKGKEVQLKPKSKGKAKAKAVSPAPVEECSEQEEAKTQDGAVTDDSRYGTASDSDSDSIYVTAVPAPKSKIIRSRPSTGRLYSSMPEKKPKVSRKSKGSTVPTAVSNDTEGDSSSSPPPPRSQGRKSGLSFIKFGGDQLSSRPKNLKRKRSGSVSSVSSVSSFVVADKEEKKMHGTYREGKLTSEEESLSDSESESVAARNEAPLVTRTGPKLTQDSPKPAFTRGFINAPSSSLKKRDSAAVSASDSESDGQSDKPPQKKARKLERQAADDSETSSDEDLPLVHSARATQNSMPGGTGRKLVKAGDMNQSQTQSKVTKPGSASKPNEVEKVKTKPKERVKPKDRPRPKPSAAAAARLSALLDKRQAEAESTSSESEAEASTRRKPSPMQRSPSSADPLQLESPPRQAVGRNAQASTSSIEPTTSERKPNISKNVIELSSSPEPDHSLHSRSVSRVDRLPDCLLDWEKVFLRSKLGTVDKIRKTIGNKTNIPGFVDHLVAVSQTRCALPEVHADTPNLLRSNARMRRIWNYESLRMIGVVYFSSRLLWASCSREMLLRMQ
jgi:hypothetical protein